MKKNKKNNLFYGRHSCMGILENNSRFVKAIFVTKSFYNSLDKDIKDRYFDVFSVSDESYLYKLSGNTDKHQSIVIQAGSLIEDKSLGRLLEEDKDKPSNLIVLLDKVQDPQNIGAIIRSSYCFNASCLIMSEHGSPDITPSVSRSSVGYSEILPIYFMNLSVAIKLLKKHDFTIVGLDGDSDFILPLKMDDYNRKTVFICGSEGNGLRSTIMDQCDIIYKIPMKLNAESLNVSNALAISASVHYSNFFNK